MNIVSKEQRALFIQSYHDHYDRLLVLAECLLENPHLAEELTQETFAIAWNRIGLFSESNYSLNWLYNTLKYCIIERDRERECFLEQAAFAEDTTGGSYDEEHILLAYQGLVPEDDLRLLYQRIILQMSYKQLMSELNISLSACKMRVSRAKARFRKAYRREFGNNTEKKS